MKRWVLVKTFQLVVEDVEICGSFQEAKDRFEVYTGMSYDKCQMWKTSDKYDSMWDYDQSKIFEIDVEDRATLADRR